MKFLCFLTLLISFTTQAQIIGAHGNTTPSKMIINPNNEYSLTEKEEINKNPALYFEEFSNISKQIFVSYRANLKSCKIKNVSKRKIKNYAQFLERHIAVLVSLSDPDQIKKQDKFECKVTPENQEKLNCLIPQDQKNFMTTLYSHPAFGAYLKAKEKIPESQVSEINQTFKAIKNK